MLKEGDTLDRRYYLTRLIGKGGMGAVFEAKHKILDKQVAIKLLHPQFAEDAEALERFYREARTASKLGHEGIIEIQDVGQADDGSPYLVMELLTGESLADLLEREGVLEPRFALDLTAQILSVLVAVHDQDIIHRDLKPDNMFLCPRLDGTYQVKILDFGICKIATDETGPKLTRTGIAMGTPYYMSREQARGDRDLDHRTDIWSTGTILYEMLTGHVPYEEDHYNLVISRLLTEDYPHPRELMPELPEKLENVLLRAMALEPNDRYPTAADFLADVLDVREKVEGQGIMDTDPDRTSMDVELPAAKQDTDQAMTIAEGTTSKREAIQPEIKESTLLQGYEIARTPEAVPPPAEVPQAQGESGTADTFMAVTTRGTTGTRAKPRRPMWLVGAGLAVVVVGGFLIGVALWFAASNRGEEQIELADPSEPSIPIATADAPEPVKAPELPVSAPPPETRGAETQENTEDVEPSVELSHEEPSEPRSPENTPQRSPRPASPRPATQAEPRRTPATQAPLTQAEVSRRLARHGAQVRRCLVRGGSPRQQLRVRVRVDGQGQTQYLGASPTPSHDATRCLWSLFSGIRFRATGGSSFEVSHTFRGRGLLSSPFER